MLTLHESATWRDCGGTSRREFLRVGALGLGGWSLAHLLAANARGAPLEGAYRGKSVVLVFLCGGASHIETFDPKMSAPAEFRSVTGELPTAIPGVTFGGTFPGLAARAGRLAVVRSFAPHAISDHAQAIKHVLTSGDAEGTSIGARFARLRGASHPQRGMPSYATLIEQQEVDSQYQEDRDRMNVGSRSGALGPRYAPFAPGSGEGLNADMQLDLPADRFHDRRRLLQEIDRVQRRFEQWDQSGTLQAIDEFRRQAYEVLLGGSVRQALDVSREDPRIVARYDTSGFQVGWLKKRPSTLGRRLLLARRLCQAGCGFVTVGSAGWDNHANANHPNVYRGMHLLGGPLDRALSAFLDDVHEQGLADDILLVVTSEFGRTPKIDRNGGRDHWPGLDVLVFSGGGLPGGVVIGESTSRAEEPKSRPLGYDDLLGTLWHTLFDVGTLRLRTDLPRSLQDELARVRPIPQLQ
jgi:uncharacterized protein (DUF1501 family)